MKPSDQKVFLLLGLLALAGFAFWAGVFRLTTHTILPAATQIQRVASFVPTYKKLLQGDLSKSPQDPIQAELVLSDDSAEDYLFKSHLPKIKASWPQMAITKRESIQTTFGEASAADVHLGPAADKTFITVKSQGIFLLISLDSHPDVIIGKPPSKEEIQQGTDLIQSLQTQVQ